MSEETPPPSPEFKDRRDGSRRADDALSKSSPDELTTFRELIGDFLSAAKGKLAFVTTMFAGITLLVMAVAKFGTQSILALSTLITSTMAYKAEEKAADRAAEIERIKLSPANDARLDAIVESTSSTNVTVRAMAEDVERIEQGQSELSERQTELSERVTRIENAHGGRR